MKKFFLSSILLLFFFGYTNSQKQPKKPSEVNKTNTIDTTKKEQKRYRWYGQQLTREDYLDTLEKRFKKFNDSLRKSQGVIFSK